MTLTAKDVAEIMRLIEESSFDSLSLEVNGVKLNLQRSSARSAAPDSPSAPSPAPQVAVQPGAPKVNVEPPFEPGLAEVISPLLGVFYRAPKPGEPPFVDVGGRVEAETVIGIIEVMKLMNSVRAGVKGQVVQILGENGALVEYGQILLRVRPEA